METSHSKGDRPLSREELRVGFLERFRSHVEQLKDPESEAVFSKREFCLPVYLGESESEYRTDQQLSGLNFSLEDQGKIVELALEATLASLRNLVREIHTHPDKQGRVHAQSSSLVLAYNLLYESGTRNVVAEVFKEIDKETCRDYLGAVCDICADFVSKRQITPKDREHFFSLQELALQFSNSLL